MGQKVFNIVLFLLSFALMTLMVLSSGSAEWHTAITVAGGGSLVAVLIPVKGFKTKK